MRFLVALISILFAAPCAAADIVIYRCTDTHGGITLQDTPCRNAAQQERRSLPAPPPAPVASDTPALIATAPTKAPDERDRSAPDFQPTRRTPQPLFLFERHDGETYENTTGIPERRWVPLWALGDDPRAPATALDPDTIGRTSPLRRTARDGTPALAVSAQTLGTWVEDICRPLSPEQICARHRDTLAGFGRRIFNAGQSEGDRLRAEESALRTRLQEECG